MTPEVEARQIAALGLARQGYAIVQVYGVTDGVCACGKADCGAPGKHGGRGWLEQATSDPDTIRTRFLLGDPNYGVVAPPGSRLLTVDEDTPGALDALGPLPGTLTVRTGMKPDGTRGRHVYGRLPTGIEEAEVPYQWAGGEVRIAANGHVVGPYSRHRSGVLYEPFNGSTVAELPETWVRALIASGIRQRDTRNDAKDERDPGWFEAEPGRHDFLKTRGRHIRGVGVSGVRLRDELRRLNIERCRPPKAEAEVDDLAAWVNEHIADDPPGATASPPTDLFANVVDYCVSVPDDVPWAAKPLAYFGGVTLLAGIWKGGKSTLAAQLQRARETGEPFLGQPVPIGPTVLVTEEGGIPVKHKVGGLTSLRILDRRAATLAALDFDGVLAALRQLCAGETEPVVMFIDTFAVWGGIENENDATEVTAAIVKLTMLAQETGAAVVLIHHTRKDGGTYGSRHSRIGRRRVHRRYLRCPRLRRKRRRH